jgi:rhodanese-related sulfurtransferase
MPNTNEVRFLWVLAVLAAVAAPGGALAHKAEEEREACAIVDATVGEENPKTAELSTAAFREVLRDRSAVVLDARPRQEWATSHVPGALNVAPKPGMPPSLYTSDVAEVGRLVDGDRSRALVLYCNGPFCGKSKRLADDLLKDGYTNVRRYQLGAPVWRALGGVMVIEPDGARYVYAGDATAVFIDARDPGRFAEGTVPGARNLPRSLLLPGRDVGEVKAAKDDGRLPMNDHATRIVVFGEDAAQASAVAAAIAQEAVHGVTYFDGSAEELMRVLGVR